MASRRGKIPIVVSVTDNVGIPPEEYNYYKKLGLRWHNKLLGTVTRGDLKQGKRTFYPGDNIKIVSTICANMQYVDVTIGAEEDLIYKEEKCYCCSPCLVAGLILDIYADYDEETEIYTYSEDAHYYADIKICQSGTPLTQVSRTEIGITKAAGATNIVQRSLGSMTYYEETVFHAVFSDYQNHQPGDSILVLIQPIRDFTPWVGEFSPCINKRQLANGAFEYFNADVAISTAYINSTGMSCQIFKDEQIWNEEYNLLEEPPVPPANDKYNPFRILPIRIDSCLSTRTIVS